MSLCSADNFSLLSCWMIYFKFVRDLFTSKTIYYKLVSSQAITKV